MTRGTKKAGPLARAGFPCGAGRYWIVTLTGLEAMPFATATSVLAPVSAPCGICTLQVTLFGFATAIELNPVVRA